MKCKVVLTLLLMFPFFCFGAEFVETNLPIRAKGMGGVYIPFPKDTEAVFVNPAYLAFIDSVGWEIATAGLGINGTQAYNDFKDIGSSSTTTDYNTYFGKSLWSEFYVRSSFVAPYFGLAGFNNYYLSGVFDNPVFPDVNIDFINDNGFSGGFGLPLGPMLSFGASIKRIQRSGGPTTVSLLSIASNTALGSTTTLSNRGVGYGADLALMARFPGSMSPSLSAVWKDVGSTAFLKTEGADAPPRIKDNLIFGFGTVIDLPGLDISSGIEYKHVTDQGEPLGKKLHLGTEISLPMIDLRAGLYQGYTSYGVGLDLFVFRLDVASYAVEKGAYPGQKKDSRIDASLTLDISIDADFNFTTKDGKRRRLKQRR